MHYWDNQYRTFCVMLLSWYISAAHALYRQDQRHTNKHLHGTGNTIFCFSGIYVGEGKRRFTWKCHSWWGLQRECQWWHWAGTGCWGHLWFLSVLSQRETEELPVKNACLVSNFIAKFFVVAIFHNYCLQKNYTN
jgi:hypothetical protein